MLMNSIELYAQDDDLYEKAWKVHDTALVIDAHAHPMIYLFSNKEHLELGKKTVKSCVDFPTMKQGGLDGVFLALPLNDDRNQNDALKKITEDILLITDQINKYSDISELAFSTDNISRIHSLGKRAVILSIEYSGCLKGDINTLDIYSKAGIRSITLDERVDHIGLPRNSKNPEGGLSDFGKGVIERMNKLGIIIDITHLSDKLQLDIINYSKTPVIASHSCLRSVNNKSRNIPDNIVKELAKKDGVIHVTFSPGHVSNAYFKRQNEVNDEFNRESLLIEEKYKNDPEKILINLRWLWNRYFPDKVKIEQMVDHIDHVVKIAGIDYVGLGSDFVGYQFTEGMKDASGFPLITYELLKRGYKEEDILKILGENLMRVFKKVENTAKALNIK